METRVILPQLGETVVEGTIIKWLKKEGESVEKDEPLVEISTDKVDTEIPSPAGGVLSKIFAEEGATIQVGDEIALIADEKGEAQEKKKKEVVTEKEEPALKKEKSKETTLKEEKSEKPAFQKEVSLKEGGRRITPVVARLISEYQIDIKAIQGTGIEGRVTKKDILNFLDKKGIKKKEPSEEESAKAEEKKEPAESGEEEIVEISKIRKSIAEHMVKSKQVSPHVTTVVEVDMTRVVTFREKNKERFESKRGAPLTYTSIIVKAAVNSLKRFPILNASMKEDKIVIKKYYNIGVAMATDDGLIVPVIKGAEKLDIAGIAKELVRLAKSAREKRLPLDALQGGTFTITNPGTYGAVFSTPIIHQPQAAILGVETIRKLPVVIDDAIAVRSMMNLCLSYDHRIIDGIDAGRFLQDLKKELEQGLALEV